MRAAIGAIAISVVFVAAVAVLRATTMTVHSPMPPESTLAVEAKARWRGGDRIAPNPSRALTIECVAETAPESTMSEWEWSADGTFEFAVRPALDQADRRQLRGCISDLRMPSLIVEVTDMRWTLHPDESGSGP